VSCCGNAWAAATSASPSSVRGQQLDRSEASVTGGGYIGGNVDGVGTVWSVILGVLLVPVVVHGQKACDIHRKVCIV
jgi:ABC-type xylose transport system permease subunit